MYSTKTFKNELITHVNIKLPNPFKPNDIIIINWGSPFPF